MKPRPAFFILIALLFAASLSAPLVHADELALGDAGHVALSVERLFGYSHISSTRTTAGVDSTETANIISFLGNAGAISYSLPRVGGDVFVAPNFSLGLAGVVIQEWASGGGSSDVSATIFQVEPRLGYLLRAAPTVAVWPRVGLTYVHSSSTSTSTTTNQKTTLTGSLTAVTIEAPIAIRLWPRVAALIVPFGDIGVSGSNELGLFGSNVDVKETEFGVQMGILIFL